MEEALGYVIFGTGWPILIVGSIWAWRRAGALEGATRRFLGIALGSFYVLGYTCTVFWRGGSWIAGVLPAFVVFLILFVATLQGVAGSTEGPARG